MYARLKRLYFKIGLHTAPPGTLCYRIHSCVARLSGKRIRQSLLRYGDDSIVVIADHVRYNLVYARQTRQVDGLALIFFLGLGDYFMATPFIEALRIAHPDIPIYAYASTTTDAVNSPLVADQLRANPCIDKVFTYQGRQKAYWKNYDFREALKSIPKNFLVLPVLFDTQPQVPHRVTTLMETFGLPAPWPIPSPIFYERPLSAEGHALLRRIRDGVARSKASAVVYTHFDARSSGYSYPEAHNLIRGLLADGYFVVDLSQTSLEHERFLGVNPKDYTPHDTIGILRALKSDAAALYIVSLNSVMWPISAGLNIKNLGLHFFFDESIHQYWHPNIFVISQHRYSTIPASRLFLAPYNGSYTERQHTPHLRLTTYDPAFVLSCFRTFVAAS